jgi:glyoxylase-like metal-dependent hydrolase (beta-lactamase superfamily II)
MKFPVLSRSSYVPIIAESIDDVFKSWQKILNEGAEIIYPAHGKIFKADVLRELIAGRSRKLL